MTRPMSLADDHRLVYKGAHVVMNPMLDWGEGIFTEVRPDLTKKLGWANMGEVVKVEDEMVWVQPWATGGLHFTLEVVPLTWHDLHWIFLMEVYNEWANYADY